jgi:hypothetical protein
MSDQYDEPTDDELIAFEASLKSLIPSRSQVDRDALIFRAGQMSAPSRPSRFWIATAASLAALALVEGALLANRPAPGVVEKIVVVQAPVPAPAPLIEPEEPREEPPVPAPLPHSYLQFEPGRTAYDRLTWQVMRYGLDGLPTPVKSAWTGHEPRIETSRQMLRDELRNLLEPGDPS